MKSKVKTIFIVIIAFIVAIVIAWVVLNFTLKERVMERANKLVERTLGQNVTWQADMRLSGNLLRPSVHFSKVLITKASDTHDTLTTMESLTVSVRLSDILKNNDYRVKSIAFSNISLKSTIKDGFLLSAEKLSGVSKGNIVAPEAPIGLTLRNGIVSLSRDSVTIIDRIPLRSESTLLVEKGGKRVSVMESNSSIGDLPFTLVGTGYLSDGKVVMDATLESDDLSMEAILNLFSVKRLFGSEVLDATGRCAISFVTRGVDPVSPSSLAATSIKVTTEEARLTFANDADTLFISTDGSFDIIPLDEGMILKYICGKSSMNGLLLDTLRGTTTFTSDMVTIEPTVVGISDGVATLEGVLEKASNGHSKIEGKVLARDIDIEKSMNTLSAFSLLIPSKGGVSGDVDMSLNFTALINGSTIIYESIVGSGNLHSEKIRVEESDTFNDMKKMLQMGNDFDGSFDNIDISFTISSGRVYVTPFDVKSGALKMNISGNHGFDGTLDYLVKAEMSRTDMSSSMNSLIDNISAAAKAFGFSIPKQDIMKMNIKVSGNVKTPTITPIL